MKDSVVDVGRNKSTINRKALSTLIASLLITGTNGIIASQISLPSYHITFMRAFLGVLFLIAVIFISKHKLKVKEYPKEIVLLVLSGMAVGVQWMLIFEAYNQIGVGISTILLYCAPVVVILLSPLFFKEKITKQKMMGIGVILLGLVLINAHDPEMHINAFGIACGLASAVMLAACIILNKKVVHINGLDNTITVMLSALVVIAIYVGIKTGYGITIDADEWVWVLLLGIVSGGIGNYLYFYSISKLPAQTVCICGYLDPLAAVIFSAVFLGERMTIIQILGAVCIIGGALFSELSGVVKKRLEE